jgi:hypothetical protein
MPYKKSMTDGLLACFTFCQIGGKAIEFQVMLGPEVQPLAGLPGKS